MSPLTLQQIIEEKDVRNLSVRILIGGAQIPKWTSVSYDFAIGQVPTANITIPSRAFLPSSVVEEASVEIWVGFRVGIAIEESLVFGGAVVDSVGYNGPEVVIECVMDGPRKLQYGYNRRILVDFTNITAEEAVQDLFTLAGVANYYINLPAWLIGSAVPQEIEFSSYGEAINKVSEVDGSPWYAIPTGQVRVEVRDPIPSPSYRRTYFSGVLTGIYESQPTGVSNVDARPRINDISSRKYRGEVGNFIHIQGAVVTTIGPNGEQNSEQIIEEVDGASGQFPNGAYWIPTPPLFQDFTLSNELIDTNAKAFEVAERYFDLKNRLFEKIPLTVPIDPDVFLCSTVRVMDPRYSGISSLYFVEGYRTTIDANGGYTELDLVGGDESGTTGFASPFAEFFWKYSVLHQLIPGGPENRSNTDLGPNADQAGKLCEDLPADTGNEEQGGDLAPGEDRRTVFIALDGTASQDFDGFIVSWTWTWTDALLVEHTLTGPRVTLMIDPDQQSSIEVTLEVMDNSGRTDSITKTIYTSADYLDPGTSNDPTENDTENGGGVGAGECTEDGAPEEPGGPSGGGPTPGGNPSGAPGRCNGMATYYYIAAGEYAMGTDNNRDWNDLAKGDVGASGDIISVGSGVNFKNQQALALFGTTQGEVIKTTDLCATGEIVFTVPGNPQIYAIHLDMQEMGDPGQGEPEDYVDGIPVYTQGSPGTMTIVEAYQQALAVGFSATSAVIAVAIMMAESGLVSNATNTIGNNPPSTDRGIVQINNYYHPDVTDECAFNTACAIRAMLRISSGGSDFTPWSAFNAGTFRQFLTQVQEAVGYTGNLDDEEPGTEQGLPAKGFKVWLGTSDGQIWISNDSGRTWTRWVQFPNALPIVGLRTERPGIWAFGGDTSLPETLIQVDQNKNGQFVSVPISGALKEAIEAAGPGFYCNGVFNPSSLLIMFSGGVDPLVWTSNDPINNPDSWVPSVGITDPVEAVAPGYSGEYIVA